MLLLLYVFGLACWDVMTSSSTHQDIKSLDDSTLFCDCSDTSGKDNVSNSATEAENLFSDGLVNLKSNSFESFQQNTVTFFNNADDSSCNAKNDLKEIPYFVDHSHPQNTSFSRTSLEVKEKSAFENSDLLGLFDLPSIDSNSNNKVKLTANSSSFDLLEMENDPISVNQQLPYSLIKQSAEPTTEKNADSDNFFLNLVGDPNIETKTANDALNYLLPLEHKFSLLNEVSPTCDDIANNKINNEATFSSENKNSSSVLNDDFLSDSFSITENCISKSELSVIDQNYSKSIIDKQSIKAPDLTLFSSVNHHKLHQASVFDGTENLLNLSQKSINSNFNKPSCNSFDVQEVISIMNDVLYTIECEESMQFYQTLCCSKQLNCVDISLASDAEVYVTQSLKNFSLSESLTLSNQNIFSNPLKDLYLLPKFNQNEQHDASKKNNETDLTVSLLAKTSTSTHISFGSKLTNGSISPSVFDIQKDKSTSDTDGSLFDSDDMNISDISSNSEHEFKTNDVTNEASFEFDDIPFSSISLPSQIMTKKTSSKNTFLGQQWPQAITSNVIPTSVFISDDWSNNECENQNENQTYQTDYNLFMQKIQLSSLSERFDVSNNSQNKTMTLDSSWDEIQYYKPKVDIMPIILEVPELENTINCDKKCDSLASSNNTFSVSQNSLDSISQRNSNSSDNIGHNLNFEASQKIDIEVRMVVEYILEKIHDENSKSCLHNQDQFLKKELQTLKKNLTYAIPADIQEESVITLDKNVEDKNIAVQEKLINSPTKTVNEEATVLKFLDKKQPDCKLFDVSEDHADESKTQSLISISNCKIDAFQQPLINSTISSLNHLDENQIDHVLVDSFNIPPDKNDIQSRIAMSDAKSIAVQEEIVISSAETIDKDSTVVKFLDEKQINHQFVATFDANANDKEKTQSSNTTSDSNVNAVEEEFITLFDKNKKDVTCPIFFDESQVDHNLVNFFDISENKNYKQSFIPISDSKIVGAPAEAIDEDTTMMTPLKEEEINHKYVETCDALGCDGKSQSLIAMSDSIQVSNSKCIVVPEELIISPAESVNKNSFVAPFKEKVDHKFVETCDAPGSKSKTQRSIAISDSNINLVEEEFIIFFDENKKDVNVPNFLNTNQTDHNLVESFDVPADKNSNQFLIPISDSKIVGASADFIDTVLTYFEEKEINHQFVETCDAPEGEKKTESSIAMSDLIPISDSKSIVVQKELVVSSSETIDKDSVVVAPFEKEEIDHQFVETCDIPEGENKTESSITMSDLIPISDSKSIVVQKELVVSSSETIDKDSVVVTPLKEKEIDHQFVKTCDIPEGENKTESLITMSDLIPISDSKSIVVQKELVVSSSETIDKDSVVVTPLKEKEIDHQFVKTCDIPEGENKTESSIAISDLIPISDSKSIVVQKELVVSSSETIDKDSVVVTPLKEKEIDHQFVKTCDIPEGENKTESLIAMSDLIPISDSKSIVVQKELVVSSSETIDKDSVVVTPLKEKEIDHQFVKTCDIPEGENKTESLITMSDLIPISDSKSIVVQKELVVSSSETIDKDSVVVTPLKEKEIDHQFVKTCDIPEGENKTESSITMSDLIPISDSKSIVVQKELVVSSSETIDKDSVVVTPLKEKEIDHQFVETCDIPEGENKTESSIAMSDLIPISDSKSIVVQKELVVSSSETIDKDSVVVTPLKEKEIDHQFVETCDIPEGENKTESLITMSDLIPISDSKSIVVQKELVVSSSETIDKDSVVVTPFKEKEIDHQFVETCDIPEGENKTESSIAMSDLIPISDSKSIVVQKELVVSSSETIDKDSVVVTPLKEKEIDHQFVKTCDIPEGENKTESLITMSDLILISDSKSIAVQKELVVSSSETIDKDSVVVTPLKEKEIDHEFVKTCDIPEGENKTESLIAMSDLIPISDSKSIVVQKELVVSSSETIDKDSVVVTPLKEKEIDHQFVETCDIPEGENKTESSIAMSDLIPISDSKSIAVQKELVVSSSETIDKDSVVVAAFEKEEIDHQFVETCDIPEGENKTESSITMSDLIPISDSKSIVVQKELVVSSSETIDKDSVVVTPLKEKEIDHQFVKTCDIPEGENKTESSITMSDLITISDSKSIVVQKELVVSSSETIDKDSVVVTPLKEKEIDHQFVETCDIPEGENKTESSIAMSDLIPISDSKSIVVQKELVVSSSKAIDKDVVSYKGVVTPFEEEEIDHQFVEACDIPEGENKTESLITMSDLIPISDSKSIVVQKELVVSSSETIDKNIVVMTTFKEEIDHEFVETCDISEGENKTESLIAMSDLIPISDSKSIVVQKELVVSSSETIDKDSVVVTPFLEEEIDHKFVETCDIPEGENKTESSIAMSDLIPISDSKSIVVQKELIVSSSETIDKDSVVMAPFEEEEIDHEFVKTCDIPEGESKMQCSIANSDSNINLVEEKLVTPFVDSINKDVTGHVFLDENKVDHNLIGSFDVPINENDNLSLTSIFDFQNNIVVEKELVKSLDESNVSDLTPVELHKKKEIDVQIINCDDIPAIKGATQILIPVSDSNVNVKEESTNELVENKDKKFTVAKFICESRTGNQFIDVFDSSPNKSKTPSLFSGCNISGVEEVSRSVFDENNCKDKTALIFPVDDQNDHQLADTFNAHTNEGDHESPIPRSDPNIIVVQKDSRISLSETNNKDLTAGKVFEENETDHRFVANCNADTDQDKIQDNNAMFESFSHGQSHNKQETLISSGANFEESASVESQNLVNMNVVDTCNAPTNEGDNKSLIAVLDSNIIEQKKFIISPAETIDKDSTTLHFLQEKEIDHQIVASCGAVVDESQIQDNNKFKSFSHVQSNTSDVKEEALVFSVASLEECATMESQNSVNTNLEKFLRNGETLDNKKKLTLDMNLSLDVEEISEKPSRFVVKHISILSKVLVQIFTACVLLKSVLVVKK